MDDKQKESVSVENQQNTITLTDRLLMFGHLFLCSETLLNNFMLLHLKCYDKLLTEQDRETRTKGGRIILYNSLFGQSLAMYTMLTRFSFMQNLPFNPLKDFRILIRVGLLVYISHCLPLAITWPLIEPIYEKIHHEEVEKIDFYAENTMSPFKVFLYKYIV